MKNMIKIIIALLMPISAFAGNYFSELGTDVSTNLCYSIVKPIGDIGRIEYINITSDLSSSAITFKDGTFKSLVTSYDDGSPTVIGTASGLSYNTNDVIVIYSPSSGNTERLVIATRTSSNITTTTSVSFEPVEGDVLYIMTANGSIPVGAATKEINATGSAVYNGQKDYPILVEVNGTSACQVNLISGVFSD